MNIFYNELEIDENNIFTANISQKNEVENALLDKNKNLKV